MTTGTDGETLESLLKRFNISTPTAPRHSQAQGYSALGTPQHDALPNASSSLLATPLSRNVGGRVSKPSPSLLDRPTGTPRPDLLAGLSRLHKTAEPTASFLGRQATPTRAGQVLFSDSSMDMPDPLASYYGGRTTSHLAQPTLLSARGHGSSSVAAYGWEAAAVPKLNSLPATPVSRQREADFSIPALRSPSVPTLTLTGSQDHLSVSLRLSALQSAMAPLQPASRLGARGSSAAEPAAAADVRPSAAAAQPASWQPLLSPMQLPTLQSSSSELAESSTSSLLDGWQPALQARGPAPQFQQQQQQQQMAQLRSAALGAGVAAQLAAAGGEMGTNTEFSILQSKVNELQAQLRLKDIEQQRVAARAAQLQEERDVLQEQVHQRATELDSWQRQCRQAEAQRLEQQQLAEQLQGALVGRESAHSANAAAQSRLCGELEAERSGAQALRQQVRQLEAVAEQGAAEAQHLRAALADSGRSSSNDVASLQECMHNLSAENQRLLSQHNLWQIEKLATQRQAEAAGERCRQAEARCQQLESELHAAEQECLGKDGRLEEAECQVSALQQRVRALGDQLVAASEECQRTQSALQEERQSGQQQRVHASASQQSEAALTSQMKSMAAQIQHLQQEAACLRAENGELKRQALAGQGSMQDEMACLEKRAAALEEENNELQAQAHRVASEVGGKVHQMDDLRGLVKQLRAKNAALQDAVRQHEAQAVQQSQQAAALQSHAELLAAERAQLQQELRASKARVAELEAAIAKSGMRSMGGPGAFSVREAVGSMRGELAEKDLLLVAAGEELAGERRHMQELQRQILDQAVEIDELQRQQSEAFSLRQQLATARQAEALLKKRVGELSQMLAAAQQGGAASPTRSAGSSMAKGSRQSSPSRSISQLGSFGAVAGAAPGPAGVQQAAAFGCAGQEGGLSQGEAAALRQELGLLKRERDQLQAECEARDAEVMQLEGQVRILRAQATDAENWLMEP